MRFIRNAVLGATLLLVVASPAHAFNWGLGMNLGYSNIKPKDGDSVSITGWPGSGYYVAPGIRVSFAPEGASPHMFYLDTSLLTLSQGGNSTTLATFIANYQYNWPVSGNTAPFLTAGGGAFHIGSSGSGSSSANAAIYGIGAGIRHKMGNGHGTLRGEVRYDKLAKGEDSGTVLVPESNAINVRVGFDLWDK